MNWGRILFAWFLVAGVPFAMAQVVGVAARVNGVDISMFRLERHFDDYLKSQGRNVGAIRNPAVFKKLKRDALEQLIDVELLWQESRRREVSIGEAEVSAQLARAEAAFRTREAWLAKLAESGFDEPGYREYVRRDLAARQVYTDLGRVDPPSDDEVRSFHAQNREKFTSAAGVAPNAESATLPLARAALMGQRRDAARKAAMEALRGAAKIERLVPL
jgi:hypothetical protein